ncbi:MAG: hypothetical protein JJU15_11975 [Pararhodobacter sp.]|nr:hypothetical protein [Pararhodobacter sp.]
MRFMTLAGATAVLALAACMNGNSGMQNYAAMSTGVGFGDYQRYLHERENARRTNAPYSVAPQTGSPRAQTPQAPASEPSAIRQAPLSAPMNTAAPANTQPQAGSNAPAFGTTPVFDAGPGVRPSLSDEQDFNAVAARETIESDRARLQEQRAQYQVIEVDSVPDASTRSGANVVQYALSTRHSVGQQQYRRINPLRWSRWENACLRFQNQDAAQEAFLQAGGPERDPNHLDPDGDGFACWWDPAPYRQAVRAGQ